MFDKDIDVSGYNGKHRPDLDRMLSRLGEVDGSRVHADQPPVSPRTPERRARIARPELTIRGGLDSVIKKKAQMGSTDAAANPSSTGCSVVPRASVIVPSREARVMQDGATAEASSRNVRENEGWCPPPGVLGYDQDWPKCHRVGPKDTPTGRPKAVFGVTSYTS